MFHKHSIGETDRGLNDATTFDLLDVRARANPIWEGSRPAKDYP
jgi:hypothetical protein